MQAVTMMTARAVGDFDTVDYALPILAELFAGRPLTDQHWSPAKWAEAEFVWRPVMYNALAIGDPVRVRQDAYTEDDELYTHNGHEGVVSGLRHGVLVNYTDSSGNPVPSLGTRHERLDALEMKVRIQRNEESE